MHFFCHTRVFKNSAENKFTMKRSAILLLVIMMAGNTYSQTSVPLMEKLFGPTTANAACGNTGLTAALSKYGEIVNLKWPLPNYYDHLNYKGLYPVPAGWLVESYNRFYNAQPLHGAFTGIEYKTGSSRKNTWLRDSTWTHKQYYLTDESPVIVTEYYNAVLQMTVKSIDFIPSNKDAFVRKFVLQWNDTNLIKQAKIIFTSNMAPCNKKPDFNPNEDWVADYNNGFANAFYSTKGQFVSFLPNPAAANAALIPNIFSSQATINNFVSNLDVSFPSLTTTTDPAALLTTKDIYTVIGANRTPVAHGMLSDYGFAQAMPDTLVPNGQSISANAAMLYSFYTLNLGNSSKADTILFQFAFGPTHQLAQTVYDSIFAIAHTTLLSNTVSYWYNKTSAATIPATGDSSMQKTLKRILINTLIGINRGSGAIGSSVCSSQPAYSQLWPRDNAIMAYMLDCAGYTSEADKACRFFADVQRVNAGEDCQTPANNECYAGTWSQCYYADGRPGWTFDFEIDEAGWGTWMLYEHSTFLTGHAKKNYLNYVYPGIKKCANFLKDFKDTVNGLQLTAREDDVLWQSQTVYGAATTLMGLKAAYSAGLFMGDSAAVLYGWQNRIAELENAIEKHKWGLQGNQYDYTVYGNFGPRAMLIWPALLKDTLNTRILAHADSLNSQVLPFYTKSNAALNNEWWYTGRTLAGLAYLWRSNPAKRPIVENYLRIALKEVPTPGTLSYGETVMVRDIDSAGTLVRRYDNRVGQPSNYPAAWFYLTAEMLYGKRGHANLYTGLDDHLLCPPLASAVLISNVAGSSYQWQVNMGGGYTNISNGSNYTNVNGQTLQLTNIPSSWYGNVYRCLADGVYSKVFTIQFANVWTNKINNDWENPGNWSCNNVPDSNSNVVINFGTVVINSNVTIRSLTINPAVSLNVKTGFSLKMLR
jgi:hypothetical protein